MPDTDIYGQRFGRLTALRRSSSVRTLGGQLKQRWVCVCDCGTEVIVRSQPLRNGSTRSCGCLQREARIRHGQHKHPLYSIWKGMLDRCNNPFSKDFERYGARGISVCKRWENPSCFFSDIGTRPSERHTLDRKNNDGDYEPGNVRWALPLFQARNRRSNRVLCLPNGWRSTLGEIASELGLTGSGLARRLDVAHESIDMAIDNSARRGRWK